MDEGKLYYIPVTPNRTYDRIMLDATNGIVWLRSIVVSIILSKTSLQIVPYGRDTLM